MVGDYVRVPVSGRKAIGVVWECDVSPDIDESKIRTILEKFDGVPLSKEMCDFVDWVSHYTLATKGMVLKMVLSVPKALESPKQKVGVKFTGESPTRLTPSRKKVMELASSDKVWNKSDLSRESGTSSSVINGLLKDGILESAIISNDDSIYGKLTDIPPPPDTFTNEQELAVSELRHTRFRKQFFHDITRWHHGFG